MDLLREMTANLMRITHGGGNPHHVFRLAFEYVVAAQKYRDITEMDFDLNIIIEALKIRGPVIEYGEKDSIGRDSDRACELALFGALQVAASRLKADHLREAQGKEEMYKAFEIWKSRGNSR